MTPTLSEQHTALLSDAAITPDIAATAGVYTATDATELPEALSGWGSGLPGIVFPWHPAGGGEPLYQLRPDKPIPKNDGGSMKYVFPAGATLCFAVHPLMADRVADALRPLVVVEGTKQALAGVSALASTEYAVIGMSGCYGWSQDGSPIPDLKAVPWRGREVYLAFDADVETNRDVWEAASGLRGWLEVQGASSVKLVKMPGGARTGLDDVLAQTAEPIEAMQRLLAGAQIKMPRRPARRKSGDYFDEDGGLLAEKAAFALLEEHPCALASDGTVAVYDAGRYIIDRDALMSFVTEMLGDRHRPVHYSTVSQVVTGKLAMDGRRLTDRPRSDLLNVRNGMLDLLTGELHPHSPEYMSIAQLPVTWDPEASCPTYERWLSEVLPSDQRDDLEEITSTMLDPARTPHKSIFLFGPSRSGKSTFLRIMRAVAGEGNTAGVTLHQLAEDKFAAASLYGKALNVAADLSSRHIEDLSIWKMLTGEDLIAANLKYGRMFNFVNQALFAFSANELPTVSEASRAYFERVKPFKFPRSFAGSEDPSIEDSIMANELSGVLRRWQRAFVRLRERGQFQPTAWAVLVEFETASDRVRMWMAEEMSVVLTFEDAEGVQRAVSDGQNCPRGSGMTPTELHAVFGSWATENGYSTLGKQKFVSRLTSLNEVVNIRLRPKSTRAINVIKKTEDQKQAELDAPVGSLGSFEPILGIGKDSDSDSTHINPYGEDGSETAQTAHGAEPAGADTSPAHLPVSALTVAVYEAIAADPTKATEQAIRTQLGLSQTEYKSERDYLVSRGVIRRRSGRGFDLLRELVPTPLPYFPLADPSLVNDSAGRPSELTLLQFPEPTCSLCADPDDGTSTYFPLCHFHRHEVAS